VRHARPLALFAALTVAWTWPLAAHPGDAIPGAPGDNYSFLWDLWWARTALGTSGLPYFRTQYLFYPFGVDMVGQSHVLGPGLVGATLLRPLSVVAAHNVMLLAFVFLNMACAYALAWDLTRHVRASIAAAIVFGLSPYLAAHVIGHFELMAAWPLPLFTLLFRRALGGSWAGAWTAAVLAVATAFTTYYYLVYLAWIALVLLADHLDVVHVRAQRRPDTAALGRSRVALAVAIGALAALATWIAATGGADETASLGISMTRPQNPLTAAWLLAIVWALCRWRIAFTPPPIDPARTRRAIRACAVLAVVFAAGTSPLLVEAGRVVARGEYVSQAYSWRSAPRGVDAATVVAGPPSHPLVRDPLHRLYSAMRVDVVEAVGWMGVLPLLIVLAVRAPQQERRRARVWWTMAGVCGLLALGPYFTIAGFDTGLRLPAILLRFVPIVSNARMPGRMMAIVFVALSAIVAVKLAGTRGRWASAPVQWTIIAALIFELWCSPIPITMLDRPAVYDVLAAQPPGAVCEVPFGVGDGLGVGVGSQERSVLYYATIHRHPLVGGVVSRMPSDTTGRYGRMAVVGDLLQLSAGRPPDAGLSTEPSPCTYFVVRRAELSPRLAAYMQSLPLERIGRDGERDLFRAVSNK